jgi:hypothetical protein
LLPIQSLVGEVIEPIPEVVAETFQAGCFDNQFWARAKFKCPFCHGRIHVVLHDGVFVPGGGRDLPIAFMTSCKLTKNKLYVRGWQPGQTDAVKKLIKKTKD